MGRLDFLSAQNSDELIGVGACKEKEMRVSEKLQPILVTSSLEEYDFLSRNTLMDPNVLKLCVNYV